MEGNKVRVNGELYQVDIQKNKGIKQEKGSESADTDHTAVKAQMPGKVMRLSARVGDYLHPGQSILVVEAMKMEVHVSSPIEGTLSDILVKEGDQVTTGDILASIN